jgi:MSHA biogenesis protein MshN
MRFFWPLLLLLSLVAGGLAWQLWLGGAASRQPAVLPTIADAPTPSTPPAALPELSPTPEAAPEAAPAPSPAAEASASIPALSDNRPLIAPTLKESTELTLLPKTVPPPKPAAQQLAAATPQPATSPSPPLQKNVPGVQASSAVPVPAAPASVTKQVRELTPQQRAESEYRKALALVQQGRVTEAIDSLNQAVQLDAQHSAARQTLIGLLVESRRFGEAERRLQEGLNFDRAQPELAMTLARLQVERGDTDAAIVTLERSQSAAIDRADYHGFMAALLQREGRHREAIEHYRQALRRTASAVWQMGLGISLQAENRFQEARDAFNRAKAANTLSPELQAFVDQRLRQLGQ